MFGFSWIIDNELAGMGRPGWTGTLEEDLADLSGQGIGALVCLTEDPTDESSVRAAGMEFLHIPIPDMAAPALEDIQRFAAFVEECVAVGRGVVAHCAVGVGRTGTMLACFLVARGMGPEEAIDSVREKRPGSVETQMQVDAVYEYGESLKDISNSQ